MRETSEVCPREQPYGTVRVYCVSNCVKPSAGVSTNRVHVPGDEFRIMVNWDDSAEDDPSRGSGVSLSLPLVERLQQGPCP